MKRRIFSFFSSILFLSFLLSGPALALDTQDLVLDGTLSYADGMSAGYEVRVSDFLGALTLPLTVYDRDAKQFCEKECVVCVLCPPDGVDASIRVSISDPGHQIYTSAQSRVYLESDGTSLSPLYDGTAGLSSPEQGDLSFPSTGLYEGWISFDYSLDSLPYTYTEDLPEDLVDSLLHFRLGTPYVLVLDRAAIAAYLENGTLEDYEEIDFPGLAELLSGEVPENLLTDSPISDNRIDREANSPAAASMDNFQATIPFESGQFSDVSDQWYAQDVATACSLGLMAGDGDGGFRPEEQVTLAEAVTMAARLHSIYRGQGGVFPSDDPWYQPYVHYAYTHGILNEGEFSDFDAPATRAQMARLFAHALPRRELRAINKLDTLPDVAEDDASSYGEEIFLLYRAGVLGGSDSAGTFYPNTPITRAEAAAILIRMALPEERLTLDLED